MKRALSLILVTSCIGMLLMLGGCKVELPEVSATEATYTTLRLLDVDILSLITKEELENAFGITLRTPQVSNEGRTLFAVSENGAESVSVSMEKRTLEQFHAALPQLEDEPLNAAPNLAEEAWWLSSGKTMFLYSRGHSISITVNADVDEESALLSSRQIASLLSNRLPVN